VDRKLQSLLELGHLIGLDLNLDEMLLQIAQKAAEVMDADRCTLFLHDSGTNELWSTVAMGLRGDVIRMPSNMGLAGACFHTGKTINLENAYDDPRFNPDVDLKTGYQTQSLLCMPLYNRARQVVGVIQLLNKEEGIFSAEDELFLEAFANQASVFIEIAQLQKARIEAMEESRLQLERLNRVKDRVLHHLSHELKTPLAIIMGITRLLRRKLEGISAISPPTKSFQMLEKHLNRLLEIQQHADEIIRSYSRLGARGGPSRKETDNPEIDDPGTDRAGDHSPQQPVHLFSCARGALDKAIERSRHRRLAYSLHGNRDVSIPGDPRVVDQCLEGLLKNAIENTPDGGAIQVFVEDEGKEALLAVEDFGVGITPENQRHILDGLYTTQETDLYSSKNPYDFGAGGKGLDLLRIKLFGMRLGFQMRLRSVRCAYLPSDGDLCPGRLAECPHCGSVDDCRASGGSTFTLAFAKAISS
jgi:signal transduction histidine kinase